MTSEHAAVLKAMDGLFYEGPCYYSFAAIAARSGVDRAKIRRIVRHLARKGLAEFEKGLWSDDGPAGAGYALTDAGRALLPSEPQP